MFHLWNISKCPAIINPAYWYSACLGTAFPWWKCPGEIAVCDHCSLPRDFLARSLSENLRNAPLKIYYTQQLCIVQDKPPYYDGFLPDDFQKIGGDIF